MAAASTYIKRRAALDQQLSDGMDLLPARTNPTPTAHLASALSVQMTPTMKQVNSDDQDEDDDEIFGAA